MVDGFCSGRAAINAANSSGTPAVIKVAPGQYNFTTTFPSGTTPSLLLPITGTVMLVGQGADTTVFTQQEVSARFFTVLASGRLQLKGLTVSNGRAECVVCSQDSGGGAAANLGGDLSIQDSVLAHNVAFGSEGLDATLGGAVVSRDGVLRIENSEFTRNSVLGAGGAIALVGGSGTIKRSTIRGNGAGDGIGEGGDIHGGGIWVLNAQLDIDHSTISGNRIGTEINEWAGYGGGIGNSGGAVSIVKSAITENTLQYLGIGAGIYNYRGTLILRDSTVAGNSAATSGGGIYNAGELQIEGVTVARNDAQNITVEGGENGLREFPVGCRTDNPQGCISGGSGIWNEGAGTVQSERSVIGLNTLAFDGDSQFGPDCRGTVRSNGYTAVGDSADCRLVRASDLPRRSADKVGIDPGLGNLEDNGDAGYAHLPVLADSPLIDAGGKVSSLCSPRDQIGQPRVDGDSNGAAHCDIGAIEYQP